MIKKFLEAEVKTLEEGKFEVVASSGKVDRLGDTIDPKGWYLVNYKKNPVILWSHSSGGFMTPAIPPVARADKVWVEDEKELRIKGHFADTPFAQELKSLVEGGFLNAVSVGFMPLVEEKEGKIEIEGKMYRQITTLEMKSYVEEGSVEINDKLYSKDGEHFTKQELLELSWVGVPALATALVSARKEMSLPLLTKALEEETKVKDIKEESKGELSGYFTSSGKIKEDLISLLKEKGIEFKEEGDYILIKSDKPAEESIEEKEGRVISEKNRKLINNSITVMEEAIGALKELLQASEPEKGTTPPELKGRTAFAKQKSKKSNSERMLIRFDKMLEILLRELRQNK